MQIQKYENLNPSSLKEVLSSSSMPIVLATKSDKNSVYVFLDAMLTEFCSIYKLDASKIMSEDEQMQCSDIIIRDYFYLKPEDLKLFITHCKRGLYGSPYGSVDMPFFFQCLEQYCEKRTIVASEQNRVKAIEAKKEPISEETLKMIAEFKEKLSTKRKIEESTQREPTEMEIKVNEWIKDFKESLYQYTIPRGGKYEPEMVRKFFEHYSELTPGGEKMLWETFKTFQIAGRLKKWSENEINFNKNGKQQNTNTREQRANEVDEFRKHNQSVIAAELSKYLTSDQN